MLTAGVVSQSLSKKEQEAETVENRVQLQG